jgi:hypothetical protein
MAEDRPVRNRFADCRRRQKARLWLILAVCLEALQEAPVKRLLLHPNAALMALPRQAEEENEQQSLRIRRRHR